MRQGELIRNDAVATGLLLLASVLLIPGLILPALETRHLGLWDEHHSILSLGRSLLVDEEWFLALVVLTFSIAVPLAKLSWMWRLQFAPPPSGVNHHEIAIGWLQKLGKWSMADVLVIALVVFSLRDSLLLQARPLIGAYCFAVSTILAMLTAGRIASNYRRQAA